MQSNYFPCILFLFARLQGKVIKLLKTVRKPFQLYTVRRNSVILLKWWFKLIPGKANYSHPARTAGIPWTPAHCSTNSNEHYITYWSCLRLWSGLPMREAVPPHTTAGQAAVSVQWSTETAAHRAEFTNGKDNWKKRALLAGMTDSLPAPAPASPRPPTLTDRTTIT